MALVCDRRTWLKGAGAVTAGLGLSCASGALFPIEAEARSASEAQAELEEAEARLEAAADAAEQAASELSAAKDRAEGCRSRAEALEAEAAALAEELDERQGRLGALVAADYKAGPTGLADLFLGADDLEQVANRAAVFGAASKARAEAVEEVAAKQAELDRKRAELAEELERAEEAEEAAAKRADELRKAQMEAASLVARLSAEARSLASAELSEVAESARDGGAGWVADGGDGGDRGKRIAAAARRVGSPGAGLCAKWVSQVYQAAGCGYPGGNACDQYRNHCTSSDKGAIQPGMMVAVPSHPHTSAGRIYGHVGIYIGGGQVMDNIGRIRTTTLDAWVSFYESGSIRARWGFA